MNCLQCERSCALCSGLKGPQRVQSGKRLGGTQAALQQPGIVPVWTQTETKLGNVSLDALGEPEGTLVQNFASYSAPMRDLLGVVIYAKSM